MPMSIKKLREIKANSGDTIRARIIRFLKNSKNGFTRMEISKTLKLNDKTVKGTFYTETKLTKPLTKEKFMKSIQVGKQTYFWYEK